MTRRTNRLSGVLSAFVQQYKRKAQKNTEPNDRQYSREAESTMRNLPPEELSAILSGESDEVVVVPKKRKNVVDPLARRRGRGP